MLGDEPGVVVRCLDSLSVAVTFLDRFRYDQDIVDHAVEVRARGLTARIDEVVHWTGEGGLVPYMEGLAADFRGWEGERTWRGPGRDLAVSAVFRSGGHMGLTWSLRSQGGTADDWAVSVTTWLEGGEQMTSLVSALRHFLDREHPGS
ncbi:DUF6228 family protein [Streptomyces sp. NPDC091278]|uniref:DUF6228 family protein n=1 Tax=Streptomyces sp. NPDC091278 TaxID=3155301 RepID=UPI00344E05EE